MSLKLAIAALPLWQTALLIIVFPTLVVMSGPVIVRRIFGAETVIANNEVAGFKFATLGVAYAVLLGLAVVAVWEKFSEAEAATVREAGAIASLYRLADGVADVPQRESLRAVLMRYTRSAIEDDWPAMATANQSDETRRTLDELYQVALGLTDMPIPIMSAVLDQLDELTNARRERLMLARGIVPGIVWMVLFVGAAMTLGFTLFFGMDNIRAQVLMIGMLAVVIFMALFVAIMIDHPFSGRVKVPPEAIETVHRDFMAPE